MAELTKKEHGELTVYTDNNAVPIKVGDYMRVRHDCNCDLCNHYDVVQVLWNDDWKTCGMRTLDGRWVGKPNIGGFLFYKG